MSDVIGQWLAANGNTSGFGPLTAAVLQTQNATQVSTAGVVASQSFLRALINACTAGGTA